MQARQLLNYVACLGLGVFNLQGADRAQGMHDPAFDSIPFAAWVAGPDSPEKLRWSAQVLPAQLSFHQRLITAATAQVDGAELARRRGKGEFVVFAQFTDAAGASYQGHVSVDLSKVEEGLSASNVSYSVRAFVRPGEYRIAILLVNSASKEHWSKTEKVTFAPLRHDPLPDAWNDLPSVTMVPRADPPESWLLPDALGQLNLPTRPKSPTRIDVLVNLTPSEEHSGSERFRNATLAGLIPTLQVISEMHLSESTMNLALLDLPRHRVVLHQNKIHDLDWDALQGAFEENTTSTIDVKSLQNRGGNAAFFVKQVSQRISTDLPSGSKHVVVVLTGATAFPSGEDLRPIEATRAADCPVFYIRYHPPVARREPTYNEERGRRGLGSLRGMGGMGGLGGYGGVYGHAPNEQVVDQLEKTLKPISPRVFDVETPEQMRKALAEIREAIENL